MLLTLLFFALNAAATAVTVYLGLEFYGYGYLAASFLTLLAGILVLDYKLKNLEYITFVMQPVH